MTALPAEDPWDPQVIYRDLPEQERELFLLQYHEAVDAAHDLAGYRKLRQLLHVWSLTTVAASQPGYYEEIDAVRNRTAHTLPISSVVPDWDARVSRKHRSG